MKISPVLILCLCLLAVAARAYHFTFSPSPGESSNVVLQYNAGWQYTNFVGTNGVSTNGWYPFGFCYPGTTNISIPSTVPSPAYLAISVEGTNYVSGPYTNATLYSTNFLSTNLPVTLNPPPSVPATGFSL